MAQAQYSLVPILVKTHFNLDKINCSIKVFPVPNFTHIGSPMPQPPLIDKILPPNRVHVLGGVSDAGKTRFIIPLMLQWETGVPIFGFATNPVPWTYVAGDRSTVEVAETLDSMNIPRSAIRVLSAFGEKRKPRYYETLMEASEMTPQPQLLVWEGFQDLCGDSKTEVMDFLSAIASYCAPSKQFPVGLTILGIVESPKQKPYERYLNPRQRISGASAWAYHTSTVMLLEGDPATNPDLTQPERDLWICSKFIQRRKLQATFNQAGHLIVP